MNTQNEIKKLLEPLVGKTKQYGGKLWKLESYEINDDRIILKTSSGKSFEKNIDSIEYFINNLEDVKADNVELAKAEEDNKVLAETLKNILLDDIDKIRADAKYIPQAKAINNNICTIINLVKLKLTIKEKG